MNHPLSEAVDPIFKRGITLIEKIEGNVTIDFEEERSELIQLFSKADHLEGGTQTWQLAKYALAVWIDEVCLTLPWNGSQWWQSNILEMEFFQSRLCNVRFFELAKQAAGIRDRHALEVFYCCVILGFRGMYGLPDNAQQELSENDYPASLNQWIDNVSKMLESAASPAYQRGPSQIIAGAPPLAGHKNQIVWATAAAFLIVLNVTLASLAWSR